MQSRPPFLFFANAYTVGDVVRSMFGADVLGPFEVGISLTVIFAGVGTCTFALNTTAERPNASMLKAGIAGIASMLTALFGLSLLGFVEGHRLGGAWWLCIGTVNVWFIWSQRKRKMGLLDAERKSIQDHNSS